MLRGWTTRATMLAALAGAAALSALAACGARTELVTCPNAAVNGQCSTSNGAAGAPQGVGGSGAQINGGSAGTGPNNGGTGNVAAGGSSGSSGFPGAGESGLAGGAAVGPHWIALSVSHAAYAYDVTRYPSTSGLVPLSSAPPVMSQISADVGPWSPDGKKLLYQDGSDWYVRDMTSDPPPTGRQLVSSPVPPEPSSPLLPQFGWSADSKTIAWVTAQSLSVFDAASALFEYEMLSTSTVSYSWAPAGDHLLYMDAMGSHLAQVDSGVVSHEQPFAAGAFTAWSPDGKYLVTSTNGGLTLIDVTGNTAVTTVITKPTIATPSVTQVMFSADSSFLVFAGAQVRPPTDVFYVSVEPSIGVPVLVSNGLANMMLAADRLLFVSPDGHWLGYSTTNPSQGFAAELSGGQPSAQFALLLQGYTSYAWLHEQPQDFLAFAESNAGLFNLTAPASIPYFIPTTGSFSQSVNPVADILLSNDLSQISLLDVTTMTPPSTIDVKLERPQVVWSPDGQFISMLDAEPGGATVELIRVTGALPSPRVAIAPPGSADSISSWPPVFP